MTIVTIHLLEADPQERRWLEENLGTAGYRVRSYENGDELLARFQDRQVTCPSIDGLELLILDLDHDVCGGPALLEAIAARALPLPVIAATRDGNLKTVVQVLRAGTLDVLEKPYRGSDLEQRLHELLPDARRYRDRAQASLAIAKRIGRLTPREHDVLAYLIQGLQNKVIAQKLGISHRTVELYRARIMEKMQAPSLVHLVAMSFLCGKELPSEKPEHAVWARSPDGLALTR